MTRRGSYSKLIDFAALLLVGAVYVAFHPHRVELILARFFPARPPTTVSTASQVKPSPTVVASVVPQSFQKSPICSQHGVDRRSLIPLGQMAFKKLKKAGSLPVLVDSNACYVAGESYPVLRGYHPLAPDLNYFRMSDAKVKVVGIHVLQEPFTPEMLKQIEDELGYRQNKDAVSVHLAHDSLINHSVQILDVQFQSGALKFDMSTRAVGLRLSFASIITQKSSLDDLIQAGAQLVDIRSHAEFSRKHDPRALNVPYTVGFHTMRWHVLVKKYEDIDQFDVNRLPDKKKKLIFVGQSQVDFATLRALTIAKLAGWNDLTWYLPGEVGLEGVDPNTPSRVDGIEIVDAKRLVGLTKTAGAVPVNVLAPGVEPSAPIPNAVAAPYTSATPYFVPLLVDNAEMKQARRAFSWNKLPPKSKPLIFFGIDSYDWAPLRAAIWAKQAGWKVYWYRGGLLDWDHDNAKEGD